MQTTFKLFLPFLLCLVLPLLSGCGGGVPRLTPAEQAEVDKFMAEHGRDAMVHYLQKAFAGNENEQLILKYLKYFVSQGTNVDAQGRDRNTPLHLAIRSGNTNVIKFLVSNRADVNAKGDQSYSPLGLALRIGDTETIKFLVSSGADVNARGNYHTSTCTPLHRAALDGNVEIVKFFVSKGADVNARGTFLIGGEFSTPLDMAKRSGNAEVIRYLESVGAKSSQDL